MAAPKLTVSVTGSGVVDGDQLNTYLQTCDTMAELRNFIGIPGVQVFVRGFNAPNDGGQGNFYWNATGTAADDNGVTTVVPFGAGSGEWTRLVASLGQSSGSQTFTAVGVTSFIVQSTTYKVLVIGGGGGGGNSGDGSGGGVAGNNGGGGSGGGMAFKSFSNQTIGQSVLVTVGAGGVPTGIPAYGTSGGVSSFGGVVNATGGGGGAPGTQTNGSSLGGGAGSGGDINVQGGLGGPTGPNGQPFDQTMLLHVYSRGGMAAGGFNVVSWYGTGITEFGYGGGGGGASGGNNFPGSPGLPGLVLITWP